MNPTQSSNIAIIIAVLMLMANLPGSAAMAQDQSVEWNSFEEVVQLAEGSQQPILVDVWAPWCGWCKKMRKEVYPGLSENLSNQFIWTRLNRDDHDSNLQFNNQTVTPLRLAQKLNVESIPALVFLSPQGEYLFHVSGFIAAENLQPVLEYVVSGSHKEISFDRFLTNNQY